MTKSEFFAALGALLEHLPEEERKKTLDYYEEAIADRVDDGMTEEEAVAAVGTPEEAADALLREMPLARRIREKVRTKHSPLTVVLLVLGSPLWLSVALAALAVAVSVVAAVFAVFIALWAVCIALLAALPLGLMGAAGFLRYGPPTALLSVGAGLVCGGLGILLLIVLLKLTKAFVKIRIKRKKG